MAVESVSRIFQAGKETRPLMQWYEAKYRWGWLQGGFGLGQPYRPYATGQSYDQAISSYYADLQKDSSQREREFLKNKDWKQVRSTIYASILPLEVMEKGEDAIKAYIESNYPEVSTFLNRLEALAD